MRKSLLFFVALMMCSLTISAQSNFVGTWKGKTKKDGKSAVFTLKMNKNGTFTMAYDLNPNDLSVMGNWIYADGRLSFKGSDEELQFRKLNDGTKSGKKGFLLKFKRGKKTVGFQTLSNVSGFFGWDEGVAAVVINHEEQYSRK